MTAYWLPHTSSVDFCEPNYLLTSVAVEPWNAVSSLFISLFGIIGLLYSNPTRELRVSMLYLLLVVIGLGSFALHASLHWFAQSLDELPMLWFNVFVLYFLCTLHTPMDLQSTTVDNSNTASLVASSNCDQRAQNNAKLEIQVAVVLTVFTVGITFVYYSLQSFYIVFVAGYIFTVSSVFAWTVALVSFSPDNRSGEEEVVSASRWEAAVSYLVNRLLPMMSSSNRVTASKQQCFNRMTRLSTTCLRGVVLVFVAIGFSCWLVDMHHCQSLLPYYTTYAWGMTFHVIWHLGAAYGGYLFVQTLILLRARALGVDLHILWPMKHHALPHDGGESRGGAQRHLLTWFCLPILCEQKTLQKSNSVEFSFQQMSTSCDDDVATSTAV
mmetsp:Transcript_11412/g.18578  ORF Transcript_11412/g.18578 Transcript_11412/m.18578 type:complete len:383 (-) Transcript_11412:272-1420(-)